MGFTHYPQNSHLGLGLEPRECYCIVVSQARLSRESLAHETNCIGAALKASAISMSRLFLL